jgi:hypothetical protein
VQSPLLEPIMQLGTLCNVPEQIKRYPKPAPKIPLGKHGMVKEGVNHVLVVRVKSSPLDNRTTED